ncbi:MAG TPA: histidine kinase [Segetibacter sp.]
MFECFLGSIIPIFHDFQYMASQRGVFFSFIYFCFFVLLMVTPTVNAILGIKQSAYFKSKLFAFQQAIIYSIIIILPTLATLVLNYYNNHLSTKYFKWAISYSIFSSAITGICYLFYTYSAYEKQQLLQAKQLDYSRLNELKMKAELEALHSKINPHFLYNALNSIADLTITDNNKAREMTIALSDLFRYTINYNDSVFSTVKDEIAMAETYLQIEKIRFEELLQYKIQLTDDVLDLKLPRFILQPLVENAVKHGLAGIDKKSEILIAVEEQNNRIEIKVFDNGKPFERDMTPGYGLKSVLDKLQILYNNDYKVEFINEPKKHIVIVLNKDSQQYGATA